MPPEDMASLFTAQVRLVGNELAPDGFCLGKEVDEIVPAKIVDASNGLISFDLPFDFAGRLTIGLTAKQVSTPAR